MIVWWIMIWYWWSENLKTKRHWWYMTIVWWSGGLWCSPRSCSSLATSSSSPRSLLRTLPPTTFTSDCATLVCVTTSHGADCNFISDCDWIFVIVITTNIVIGHLCFNNAQPFNLPLQFLNLLLLIQASSSSSEYWADDATLILHIFKEHNHDLTSSSSSDIRWDNAPLTCKKIQQAGWTYKWQYKSSVLANILTI